MTRRGRYRSPSSRWTSQHGTKIIHAYFISALWHAVQLFIKGQRPVRYPYRCRFGQWYMTGETAPPHWHVGRRPTVWK